MLYSDRKYCRPPPAHPIRHALYAVFTDAAALLDYVESYEAEPEDVWKEKILGKYNAEK